MVERTGALGCSGDVRRAAVGTELTKRVTATGSLVIRKPGETRAGERAIHLFIGVFGNLPGDVGKLAIRTLVGDGLSLCKTPAKSISPVERSLAAGLERLG